MNDDLILMLTLTFVVVLGTFLFFFWLSGKSTKKGEQH